MRHAPTQPSTISETSRFRSSAPRRHQPTNITTAATTLTSAHPTTIFPGIAASPVVHIDQPNLERRPAIPSCHDSALRLPEPSPAASRAYVAEVPPRSRRSSRCSGCRQLQASGAGSCSACRSRWPVPRSQSSRSRDPAGWTFRRRSPREVVVDRFGEKRLAETNVSPCSSEDGDSEISRQRHRVFAFFTVFCGGSPANAPGLSRSRPTDLACCCRRAGSPTCLRPCRSRSISGPEVDLSLQHTGSNAPDVREVALRQPKYRARPPWPRPRE